MAEALEALMRICKDKVRSAVVAALSALQNHDQSRRLSYGDTKTFLVDLHKCKDGNPAILNETKDNAYHLQQSPFRNRPM